MKKNLYLVMLASAFLAGCQSEDLVQSGANQNLKTMEITAGMGELDSRTSYTDGGVKWQAGDALSVFVGNNTNYKFTIKEGIGENEAKFEGQAAASITYPNCVAYYPYAEDVTLSYKDKKYTLDATFPAVQQYAAGGSFGQNALPMVAVNETNEVAESFQFKKLGGWLQLYVKGNATITKVVMKAKGHKIAGNYTVTAAYGVTPTVAMADDAVSYISLNCGEGVVLNNEEATLFTFAVAPFTFGAGEVSFDIYDNQGTFMPNAFTIEKGATILSNAVYRLGKSNNVAYQGVKPVAKIGEIAYASLQAALEDVEDGQTITLLDDVTVTEAAYGQNALNYAKAVSCTIDLNEKTLSANTGNSVFRFNISAVEDVTTDVTITMKNGKVIAGSDTWCAVMAAGKAENAKAIFNLEDLTIENSKPGDLAVKSWSNAVVNANSVTVNSTNAAGGFYAVGGEMNLDDCTVEQKGLHAAPYLSMAFAVSNGGKMTINSGNYSSEPTADSEGNNQGTSHGSWVGGVMNSGGTLIINDGTFTNGNYGDDEQATAARGLLMVDTGAKLEINDGTFHALKGIIDYQNNLGDAANNPVVTIKGGSFNADPFASEYVNAPEGFVAVKEDDTWKVIECTGGVMIGSTPYESLQAAFDAAQNNDIVTLYKNIDLTETVALAEGKNITLELNNFKVSTADKNVIRNDGGVLTIKNGSIERTGEVVGYAVNNASGEIEIEKVSIVRGLYTSGNKMSATNSNITHDQSSRHAIYAYNCEVVFNGGTYHNNNAGNATLMAAGSSKVTINNGTFSINDGRSTLGWTSCLLDLNNSATMDVKGGTFNGGFRVQAGTNMNIEGGSFNDCYGSNYNIFGSVSVKGGTYTDNAAKNFAKSYVADGFVAIVNADGTYSVIETISVTSANIADVFANISTEKPSVFVLTENIVTAETLVIPEGANVLFDLDDNTISGKGNSIVIDNQGELKIIGGGTVINTVMNGKATINNCGSLVLEEVAIVGAPIGGDTGYPAYCITNSANLTVGKNTVISADRGCLFLSGIGETIINGGSLTNNNIADKLGERSFTSHVVVVGYGANNKLTIDGGIFQHNHTSTSGGVVINNWSAVTVDVNGGIFSGGNYFGKWDNLSDYGYGSTKTPFAVKGGTFTGIDDNYVVEGYKAIDNGNGTWTVKKDPSINQ